MTQRRLWSLIATPIVATLVMLGTSSNLTAQEWTRFRGPNGTGASDASTIPTQWTASDYNWAVGLPGVGHSSPVVWGDKIFLTSGDEETAERMVLCLAVDDGALLWQRTFDSTIHTKHVRNSFGSVTPAVDAERVYVAWSTPEEYTFLALDHNGGDVWRRDLGPFVSQHSCGISPIVYEDMVILGNDQDEADEEGHHGESFLIAVDARTGETRWQTSRASAVVAYSTPCVYDPPDEPAQLIFNSQAHGISSIDPHTGKTNWEQVVFDKRSCSSPIIAGGVIFGSCGSGGGGNFVVALRPGKVDGSRSPELAYRIDTQAPYVPTPIANGDLVFLWSDKGIVTCIRASSGEVVWRERVGGNYSGSPIRVGDRLYCIDEEGVVVVLSASEKYEVLARNPLGEESRATPSVADGRLYLRTYSHLISVGGE